ncbi:MAG: IS200/IS605 family transposase [Verrucomicrobiota bacterium]
MPQSLSNVILHLVFSTKDRLTLIGPSVRSELHAFLAGTIRAAGCECLRVGGPADHVHFAIRFSRTKTIAELVEDIKTASSKWTKAQSPDLAGFAWQRGYAVFSVGPGDKQALLDYIDNQEEHHRTRTFQEEVRSFLKKYEVAYDERYVWD